MTTPLHSNFISLKELASLLVELDIASDFQKPLKTSHPFASGFDWLTKNSDILLKSQVLYTFGDEVRSRQNHEDSIASQMNGILFINNLCNFYAYRSMKGITEDDIVFNGFSRKQVLLSLEKYTDMRILRELINDATDFDDDFTPINTYKQDLNYAVESLKAIHVEKIDLIKDKAELENQLAFLQKLLESKEVLIEKQLSEIESLKLPESTRSINSILKIIASLAKQAGIDLFEKLDYAEALSAADSLGIDKFPEDDTYRKWLKKAQRVIWVKKASKER